MYGLLCWDINSSTFTVRYICRQTEEQMIKRSIDRQTDRHNDKLIDSQIDR